MNEDEENVGATKIAHAIEKNVSGDQYASDD